MCVVHNYGSKCITSVRNIYLCLIFVSEGSVALGRIILYLKSGSNFYFFTNHFLLLGNKSAHFHVFPEATLEV